MNGLRKGKPRIDQIHQGRNRADSTHIWYIMFSFVHDKHLAAPRRYSLSRMEYVEWPRSLNTVHWTGNCLEFPVHWSTLRSLLPVHRSEVDFACGVLSLVGSWYTPKRLKRWCIDQEPSNEGQVAASDCFLSKNKRCCFHVLNATLGSCLCSALLLDPPIQTYQDGQGPTSCSQRGPHKTPNLSWYFSNFTDGSQAVPTSTFPFPMPSDWSLGLSVASSEMPEQLFKINRACGAKHCLISSPLKFRWFWKTRKSPLLKGCELRIPFEAEMLGLAIFVLQIHQTKAVWRSRS